MSRGRASTGRGSPRPTSPHNGATGPRFIPTPHFRRVDPEGSNSGSPGMDSEQTHTDTSRELSVGVAETSSGQGVLPIQLFSNGT